MQVHEILAALRKQRSYKPLDGIRRLMLLQHELEFIKEGFVKHGGTTLVWSGIYCPDCDAEFYYDVRNPSKWHPPQVRVWCINGHTSQVSTPIPAEAEPI